MEINGTNIKQKLSNIFYCEICHYNTCRKSNLDNHNRSAKHLKEINGTKIKQILSNNSIGCEICHKSYQTNAGLWKHKSNGKCSKNILCKSEHDNKITIGESHIDINDKDQLILMIVKQNSELIKETTDFKNIMMEQQNIILKVLENGTHNITNTHTNSHNKAFNLNFFLNDTCKDAMNIMDFVESIKLQVSDLESVGELGYIEGISNIIVKNLNALDVTQRPVHCTDKKRETIYIKDDNKWEKDEEQKKMHKMIKKVADKNARLLPKFTEKYPDYKNYHSKTSDKYSKIIIEAMGGSGDNDYEKEEKIIKNIAKNILVEKGH
jgi:hypothetical protein